VVSPRAGELRVVARRRPGEGRLQDVEEWRGTDDLHRRGPREGPGRERGDRPGEGTLQPRGGGGDPAAYHGEGRGRSRTQQRRSRLPPGPEVLTQPRPHAVRRLADGCIRE